MLFRSRDRLQLYGYDRETSPELDAIAREAVVFDNAFATSPWTLPSFGSLFTGRLPAEHLAVTNTPIEKETTKAGMKTLRFKRTQPMPTYILAMATGPFVYPVLAKNWTSFPSASSF